jgi:multidrug efflux pump subunit AcrA (membrane-fusion protein)
MTFARSARAGVLGAGVLGASASVAGLLVVGLVACGEAAPSGAGGAGSPANTDTPANADTPANTGGPASSGGAGASGAAGQPRETLGRVVTRGGVVDVGLVFDGRVRTLSASVGDALEVGDVVAEVEVPELAAAAAEARGLGAQRRVLDAQRARAETLVAEGLGPRAAVDDVDTALAELGTRRAIALAMLSTANIEPRDRAHLARHGVLRVRAPRDGVLVELLASEGSSVGRDTPLARLVGPSTAVVQITTARRPPEGQAVIVTDEGELHATPTQAPVLDPNTGLFHTFYPLSRALPHGARVTVRFAEERP